MDEIDKNNINGNLLRVQQDLDNSLISNIEPNVNVTSDINIKNDNIVHSNTTKNMIDRKRTHNDASADELNINAKNELVKNQNQNSDNEPPSKKVFIFTSPPPRLLSLSDEVLLEILKNCDSVTLDSLSRTCERFHNLVVDRKLWSDFDFSPIAMSASGLSKRLKFLNEKTKTIKIRGMVQIYPLDLWSNNTVTPKMLFKISKRSPNLEQLEIHEGYLNFDKINVSYFPKTLKKLKLFACEAGNSLPQRMFLNKLDSHMIFLEELNLERCNWIEPHYLIGLSKLPSLRKLVLKSCQGLRECVPYGSISTRFGFKILETLDIRDTMVSDSDIQCFNLSPKLRELFLEYPSNLIRRLTQQAAQQQELKASEELTTDSNISTTTIEAFPSSPSPSSSLSPTPPSSPEEPPVAASPETKSQPTSLENSSTNTKNVIGSLSSTLLQSAAASSSNISQQVTNQAVQFLPISISVATSSPSLSVLDDRHSSQLLQRPTPTQPSLSSYFLGTSQNVSTSSPNSRPSSDVQSTEPLASTSSSGSSSSLRVMSSRVNEFGNLVRVFSTNDNNVSASSSTPGPSSSGSASSSSSTSSLGSSSSSPSPTKTVKSVTATELPNNRRPAPTLQEAVLNNLARNASAQQQIGQQQPQQRQIIVVRGLGNSRGDLAPADPENLRNRISWEIVNEDYPLPERHSYREMLRVSGGGGGGAIHAGGIGRIGSYGNNNAGGVLQSNLLRIPNALISDRGICSFGLPRNNVQEGVIWIRAEPRNPDNTLEKLIVRNYRLVTDVSLRHLVECSPHLQFLDVTGTSVTEDGVRTFKLAKPNCVVISNFNL